MTAPLTELELAAITARREKTCARPQSVVMPDGTYQRVRCGSRLREVCPSCSALVVGDWAAIIRSGVFDVPTGHVWMMLTLTAPSFGPVHRVPRPGAAGGVSRRCACGEVHSADHGHLRGVPVDPDTYGYDGTVRWNRDSAVLWDATRARLRWVMPRLEYAAVREWQARGTLHHHVLLRVPVGEALPAEVVGRIAASVVATGHEGEQVRWGEQVDCQRIGQGEDTARTIWYVTKAIAYVGKSVADGDDATVPEQHRFRLWWAAQAAPCAVCARVCRADGVPVAKRRYCQAAGHRRQGAASAVVSVSRPGWTPDGQPRAGWSWTGLTRTAQREERAAWAREQAAREKRAATIPRMVDAPTMADPLAAARAALDARRLIAAAQAPPPAPCCADAECAGF